MNRDPYERATTPAAKASGQFSFDWFHVMLLQS